METTRNRAARAARLMGLAGGLTTASAFGQPDGAAPPPDPPPFRLFDAFEAATGLQAFGFAQVGVSANDVTSHDQATRGHSNFPVVGPADEGLQLNAIQVALRKEMASNLLPRVTPVPGPMPWNFSWGFRAEAMYGRNGLPAELQGWDSKWHVNQNESGVAAGTSRQSYLVTPQVYAEFFFPVAEGLALTVGRFGAGVGREIPPEFQPNPNFFYSKTYAFVSQPDQVVGALGSANLMRNDLGFLLGELGVVQGRQLFKDNNGRKSVIGALRWRSPDMRTWIDYSVMAGDEQNSPTATPAMPVARVISPRGQLRQHHSLTFTAHPADGWEVVGEALYGRQAGDGRADTIDILTGPGYKGGQYAGLNGELRYALRPGLRLGVRGEVFVDREATALFPVTAVAGDFHALTVGARCEVSTRPPSRWTRS